MAARSILAVLALVFAGLAAARLVRLGRLDPAARTWVTIAVIFALVAGWVYLGGSPRLPGH